MRPEKAERENPIGEKGRGGSFFSLSEAAGFPLEHREKRTLCLFLFLGGEGGGGKVVGWLFGPGFLLRSK